MASYFVKRASQHVPPPSSDSEMTGNLTKAASKYLTQVIKRDSCYLSKANETDIGYATFLTVFGYMFAADSHRELAKCSGVSVASRFKLVI